MIDPRFLQRRAWTAASGARALARRVHARTALTLARRPRSMDRGAISEQRALARRASSDSGDHEAFAFALARAGERGCCLRVAVRPRDLRDLEIRIRSLTMNCG